MSMQTDVKAKSVTGTGALSIGPCRIKAIYVNATTGGTLAVTAGGATVLSIVFPITSVHLLLPGEGIRCESDPTATFTTLAGNITFFYG